MFSFKKEKGVFTESIVTSIVEFDKSMMIVGCEDGSILIITIPTLKIFKKYQIETLQSILHIQLQIDEPKSMVMCGKGGLRFAKFRSNVDM
jgi:hypothetical protein